MKIINCSHINIRRNGGVTLLEVLLYIGIFSIFCISIIFLYTSILRSAHSVKINIERAEVAFFIYEIAKYKIDTGARLAVEDFNRILKYYPNLNMLEISMEYITSSDQDFSNISTPHTVKVMYKLEFKGLNSLYKKIFLHTFYINLL